MEAVRMSSEQPVTRAAPQSNEDAAAYEAACGGDRPAVREIVARYNSELLRVARAMGLADQDALDVVQFVWMRFFEHLQAVAAGRQTTLRQPELVRFWLLSVCRNAVRDVYRRRTRDQELAQRKTSDDSTLGRLVSESDSASGLIDHELRLALLRALARMTPDDQELIALLIADPPLSYQAMAEILGRPVGSIGPMRQRCLERLRVVLKGDGHE